MREKLNPADFAIYLNTTMQTIRRWENGLSKPNDAELKLLNLIRAKGIKGIV